MRMAQPSPAGLPSQPAIGPDPDYTPCVDAGVREGSLLQAAVWALRVPSQNPGWLGVSSHGGPGSGVLKAASYTTPCVPVYTLRLPETRPGQGQPHARHLPSRGSSIVGMSCPLPPQDLVSPADRSLVFWPIPCVWPTIPSKPEKGSQVPGSWAVDRQALLRLQPGDRSTGGCRE